MYFNVYYVLYSLNSHQYVSAAIAAIFSVKLLLQEYKRINLVSCAAVTPHQLKIVIISVKTIYVIQMKVKYG